MLCAGDCFVKRVRVLVANHPRLMRELVMATIADQPDIEVVGEVQNDSDLADTVEQVLPDVLIIAMDEGMLRVHRERRPVATLGVYQVSEPRRCGIVSTDQDGVIVEFVEKPTNPAGNWAFSGLMIGTPQMLDVIPEDVPADIGFHVLPRLTGRMVAFPIHDYLIDIGTMENYQKAQTTWPGFPEV